VDLHRAVVGCIVFAVGFPLFLTWLRPSADLIQTAFAQVNELLPTAIILGVIYEIRRSGGTRSINLAVLVAISLAFLQGAIGFSKQGMLTPLVCWLLPVCALRYRLSLVQVAACILASFAVFYYLVPFSQYARGQVEQNMTLTQKVQLASNYLSHPELTRQLYLANLAEEDLSVGVHYYDTPQGFFDRLQLIAYDDALIDVTDQGKVFGLYPIAASFLNVIPHALWPDKPNLLFGNLYAHEIGNFSEEDTTTGISFSPTSEAYHMARWTGVLLVAPSVWLLLFVVFDSLCGDVRASPWGMLAVLAISHVAPEGALTNAIYFITFGSFSTLFNAFFAAWIAPLCSILVLGGARTEIQSGPITPAHARR
jgi:hypothetical protein